MVVQGLADLKLNYPFLASYTYNFEEIINYLKGRSYTSSVFFGHLWTLSVEVQFYLLFPLLVYILPIKTLKKSLFILVLSIPFARLLLVNWLQSQRHDPFWIGTVLYNSTFLQLDTLALGALLALFDGKALEKICRVFAGRSVFAGLADRVCTPTAILPLWHPHGRPLFRF